MSHIPLKKIDLFTLAFSVVSWLFGNEPLLATQGFGGAAWGQGVAPDGRVKSCGLWLCIYTVGMEQAHRRAAVQPLVSTEGEVEGSCAHAVYHRGSGTQVLRNPLVAVSASEGSVCGQ